MLKRPHPLSRVLLLTIMMLSLAVTSPLTTSAQGNSQNAKLCQQGGWQSLVRADGTPFTDQGDCVSYGAQGGMIYPAAAVPCLAGGWQSQVRSDGTPFADQADCVSYVAQSGTFYPVAAAPCLAGGWATHARAESPTVAFASEGECIGYAVNGGEIVDLQTVVSDGVLTLEFLRTISPETNCRLTAHLTNFPPNTPITVAFWVREIETGHTFHEADVAVVTDENGKQTAYDGWLYVNPIAYEIQARASDGAESAWTSFDC